MQREKISIQNFILFGLIIIFLSFTLYLAFNLKMGVSPDSWYHLRVSQEFSKSFGMPTNSVDTYQWRDIEHLPYLYFWVNGRILNLNDVTFNFNQVILLRVFNIFYSFGTLVGVYLLSKEFFKSKWLRILPVFLLSNTLMFLFLSSAINYDNLGNMFAVFGILFFVKGLKNTGSVKYLLWMLIILCLGTLTKYTILPLAFILVVLIGIDVVKNWRVWREGFRGKVLYLLIPLVLLIVMNLGVYGVNLVKFHSLTPSCLDVLTYDQCLENGVFVRDMVWIPEVEVNVFDMVISGERLDPVRYSGLWVWEMVKRVVGIMGDESLFASNYIIPFYLFFIFLAVVVGIVRWKGFSKVVKFLSVSTLFYLLVLFFVQNYDMYLRRGHPVLALQGRYMFPVISSFYVLLVLFLSKIKKGWLRYVLFIGLVVLFVVGCLPFFFMNVDCSWFGGIEF